MKRFVRSALVAMILAIGVAMPPGSVLATVSTLTTRNDFTGNGVTTAFTFTFKANSASWVKVTLAGALQGSGYVVALNANQDVSPGGTVTFSSAPANAVAVGIYRQVPLTQGTAFSAYSPFPAKTMEKALDQQVLVAQQLDAALTMESATRSAADTALSLAVSVPGSATLVTATGGSTPRILADHTATITPPTDATPMKITKANGTTAQGQLSTADTFAGYAGTALTGAPRLRFGTRVPSGIQGNGDADDAGLLILRELTGDSLFSHAIRDESSFSTTTTGAYASFDAIPQMNGSIHYNHLRAFQSRPHYAGAGTIDEINGFASDLFHDGAGTVSSFYGIHLRDPTGAGPITFQAGIWIEPLARGGSNYAIYAGGTTASYHGGKWQMGAAPQVSGAGWTTYGALLSHDTTGNLISNPNLTIINGTLTMAYSTAKVLASATDLKLQSTSGVVHIAENGTGGVTIGSTAAGDKITKILRGTATLSTGAIGAGTTATQNITVTAAAVGAEVAVGGPSTLEAGLVLYAYVSATNTVTVRTSNVSAGSVTPAGSQTVSVRVFNP